LRRFFDIAYDTPRSKPFLEIDMLAPISAYSFTPLSFTETKKEEEKPNTALKVALAVVTAIIALGLVFALVKKLVVAVIILLPAAAAIGTVINHLSKPSKKEGAGLVEKPVVRRPLNDEDLKKNKGYQLLAQKLEELKQRVKREIPTIELQSEADLATWTPEKMPAAVVQGRFKSDGRPFLMMNYELARTTANFQHTTESGVAVFTIWKETMYYSTGEPIENSPWMFTESTSNYFKVTARGISDFYKSSEDQKYPKQEKVTQEAAMINYFVYLFCLQGRHLRMKDLGGKFTMTDFAHLKLIDPKTKKPVTS
jgi:hypothetical protein